MRWATPVLSYDFRNIATQSSDSKAVLRNWTGAARSTPAMGNVHIQAGHSARPLLQ